MTYSALKIAIYVMVALAALKAALHAQAYITEILK